MLNIILKQNPSLKKGITMMNKESLKEIKKVFRVEANHSKDGQLESQNIFECPKCTMKFSTDGAKRTHVWRDHSKKQEKIIN